MKRIIIVVLTIGLISVGVTSIAASMEKEHPSDEPLKIPADMGFRPYHYWNEQNEPEGYTIDLVRELADRLGRPGIKVIDVNWSGIFSGLFAKKYEMIIGGCHVTQDRAARMDFTEPIKAIEMSFAVRAEDKDEYKSLEDFEGKKLAANSGSVEGEWVTNKEHVSKYGYTPTTTDKTPDGVLAVKTGKIDIFLAHKSVVKEFTEERDSLTVLPFNVSPETDWGVLNVDGSAAAFRKGDPYRYEVEKALEGMKLDGTLQKLVAKWFGEPSSANYANVVFPGYGTPGVRAFEPENYHKPIFADEK